MTDPAAKPTLVGDGESLHEDDLVAVVEKVKHCEDVGSTTVPILRYQVLRMVDEIRQARWAAMNPAHGQVPFCERHQRDQIWDSACRDYMCEACGQ